MNIYSSISLDVSGFRADITGVRNIARSSGATKINKFNFENDEFSKFIQKNCASKNFDKNIYRVSYLEGLVHIERATSKQINIDERNPKAAGISKIDLIFANEESVVSSVNREDVYGLLFSFAQVNNFALQFLKKKKGDTSPVDIVFNNNKNIETEERKITYFKRASVNVFFVKNKDAYPLFEYLISISSGNETPFILCADDKLDQVDWEDLEFFDSSLEKTLSHKKYSNKKPDKKLITNPTSEINIDNLYTITKMIHLTAQSIETSIRSIQEKRLFHKDESGIEESIKNMKDTLKILSEEQIKIAKGGK